MSGPPRVIILLIHCFVLACISAMELRRRQVLTGMGMMPGPTKTAAMSAPEMSWGTNASHIEVQLTYPTTGWLALGLSPNGGMDQTDVLFGFVDDRTREVVIQDRYIMADMAVGVNLSLDAQQDWMKVSGSQNATHTILRAVRKLRTCDSADRPFTAGYLKVIFSYNPRDPDSKTGPIQKHTQRGTTSVNFLEDLQDIPPTEPIVKRLNITMGNFQVPGLDMTEYFCRLVQIPPLSQKLHAVSEHPIIDLRSAELIHHITINMCNKLPEVADINAAFPCDPNSNSNIMESCQTLLAGWAVGGQAFSFPPNVGLPFTEDMSGSYVLLQVHYNNPNLKKPVDDSGISFSLTNKLRQYDVGTLTTGIFNFDNKFVIPPGQDAFRVTSQCSDQCTSQLPVGGVTIFSAEIHMHTRGRVGVARHFRGTGELAPLINDQNYDFNYQTGVDVNPPRLFLPGDRIVIECTYSTSAETTVTFGGESTGDEMCLGYFDYYPKTDVTVCGAVYNLSGLIGAVGFPAAKLRSSGLTPNRGQNLLQALRVDRTEAVEAALTKKLELTEFLKAKSWTEGAVKKLEEFYRSKQYLGVCSNDEDWTIIPNDLPPFMEPYQDMTNYMC